MKFFLGKESLLGEYRSLFTLFLLNSYDIVMALFHNHVCITMKKYRQADNESFSTEEKGNFLFWKVILSSKYIIVAKGDIRDIQMDARSFDKGKFP